jgi:hypothetical protein
MFTNPEQLSSTPLFTRLSGVRVLESCQVTCLHVLVPCCYVRYYFRVKNMFGSSNAISMSDDVHLV